jgi:hypothetical protein
MIITAIVGYGDVLTNWAFGNGFSKCHRDTDLTLTSNGDLALTPNEDVKDLQSLLLYFFTAKGERYDKSVGCALTQLLHKKMTYANLQKAQGDLQQDLREGYPTFANCKVNLQRVAGSSTNVRVRVIMTKKVYEIKMGLEELLTPSSLTNVLKLDRSN